MAIAVKSEIGPLKKVMLHRPGKELEHLVPGELERLLFDDIPYLRTAQQEHDTFAGILEGCGAEVVYLEDLVAETLRTDEALKRRFVEEFVSEGGAPAQLYREKLVELFLDIPDERELVLKAMAGVAADEIEQPAASPLSELARRRSRFLLDPIPNLYFTRDPLDRKSVV